MTTRTAPVTPRLPRAGTPRERAIPALLDACGGRLYRLGTRICGSADEAEDLVQEVFLLAWRYWPDFRGESQPATWLFRIAGRVCQRRHRRRSGQPARIASLNTDAVRELFARQPGADPADQDPAQRASRADQLGALQQSIGALPEQFRLPLLLKDVLEMSIEDVALALALKPATVKTRVHRARLALRAALAGGDAAVRGAPQSYDEQTCLDLLNIKLAALDRGEVGIDSGVICARCRRLFEQLDQTRSLCSKLAAGRLPKDVGERIRAALGVG